MNLNVEDKRVEYIITLYQILKEIDENGPGNINLFANNRKPGYFNFSNSVERQKFSVFLRMVHKYQQIYNDQSVERDQLKRYFDILFERIKYPLSGFEMTDLENILNV